MKYDHPVDVHPQITPRPPMLVDQPTRAPTRKLQAATAGAGIAGSVALLAVEGLQQVPGLAFLSEGGWQAVSYIVAAGITALGAITAGYPVRDYEA